MSTSKQLDVLAFERLLELHGSRIDGWPEEWRRPAQDLLDASAPARASWAEARQLDALLNALPDVAPTAALVARIAALPVRHPRGTGAWWPFGNPFAPLLAWGAAAALGLFVGSVAAPDLDSFDADPGQDIALSSTGTEDSIQNDDWSDLSELAWGTGFALEDDK